ncbi:TetR/AcrR family transcriptional regulator [Catenuloplanes japonicus]|uniref:TetR/AcrR family transcriptional regulator n=1 Tax=Catenuloplanes japonicus TaxID=33876 RepID=UPI00068BD158|nr:TetR/AcrR family transcriptional regulator [Catenuloplanes japonicus]
MDHDEVRDRGGKLSRKPVRRDAAENRRRILTAARRLFGPGGDAVHVRDIARDAGVSAATLYRHFPARRDLMDAVLADQAGTCAASVRRAIDEPDPARALRDYVEHAFTAQADGVLFADAIREANAGLPGHADRLERYRRDLAVLVGRARAAGVVRPDLTASDVLLILAAGGGAGRGLDTSRDPAARSRRLAGIVLAGIGLSGV